MFFFCTECDPMNECGTCYFNKTCVRLTDYKKWKVGDYGSCNGIEKMKSEIFHHGPYQLWHHGY